MSELLVVASKVKQYVREKSDGMNTSATFLEALTESVKKVCDQAIERARQDGRKTVKDRDLPSPEGCCQS
ncbi:MAG: hypothetical protein A3F89_07155 [Deltaproteobacteria bacterium RIFCSPLOWO2_12_FULL_50_11]|nr:MAG: hypothetical protein A3B79_00410 [Deltaproteobacteria bacterium RIFCSPHIGHO2_02_FULL_50_15]OGQ65374.1 MAG: hypothetical protein A3F89_07155 [Deltaproteobacteria bacterium RIFCSPLOWO2_12_FULL_50_11]